MEEPCWWCFSFCFFPLLLPLTGLSEGTVGPSSRRSGVDPATLYEPQDELLSSDGVDRPVRIICGLLYDGVDAGTGVRQGGLKIHFLNCIVTSLQTLTILEDYGYGCGCVEMSVSVPPMMRVVLVKMMVPPCRQRCYFRGDRYLWCCRNFRRLDELEDWKTFPVPKETQKS